MPCWLKSPSLISLEVMAPKSFPLAPALAVSFTTAPLSFSATASASAFCRASSAFRAFSCSFMVFMASAVAGTASFRGSRKLRAYPSATSTICPFFP